MDNKYIIILFNGFGSSKIFWNYAFEDKSEFRKFNIDYYLISFVKNIFIYLTGYLHSYPSLDFY